MNVEFKDFGFYNVDIDYLKYLNGVDSEVSYSAEKAYDRKPFLGILVVIDRYTYLIPLTSAKPKHKAWKNVDKSYYLIYEVVDKKDIRAKDITKPYSDTHIIKILSALDIKKMIPVPNGLYSRIDFSKVPDPKYGDLLRKEYLFCQKIQDGILDRAKQIYFNQKKTGKVYRMFCNYDTLEKACDKYIVKEISDDDK